MQDIIKYIQDKLEYDYPTKVPTSVRILKSYEHLSSVMGTLVEEAGAAIQSRFRKNKEEVGVTTATATSIAIGDRLCHIIDPGNNNWRDHVRIGDLFLEAFHNCKYIKWTRQTENLYNTREPWTIKALDKWGEAEGGLGKAQGISYASIPDISSLYQDNGQSIIKTWKQDKAAKFEKYLDRPFVKALNRIQQTPWRINKRVHDALDRKADAFIFPPAESIQDPKDRQRQAAKIREFRAIMETARNNYYEPDLYFYASCDWRGRVYYTQNYLNYQGSDVARGQLMFSDGRPLTPQGNYWLAVHTANSYNREYQIDNIPAWCAEDYESYLEEEGLDSISVDKMSLDDRAKWTEMNMKFILTTASQNIFHPEAEKSVSFLACCIEWEGILDTPEGETYITHLPIPIDGQTNGWCHLAAMSKDEVAGDLVGLIPTDIPKDFYVKTAKELIKLIPDFFEKRNMPMKAIRKGLVKRAAMTKAYSCGPIRMAKSMWEDCIGYGYDRTYKITEEDCITLAKLITPAIAQVCGGPLEVMKYLMDLVNYELGTFIKQPDDTWKKVKGNGRRWVEWETISGFPVIYEKYIMKSDSCKAWINLDGIPIRITHRVRIPTQNADRRGYAKGIAANWVHSHDAAHMSLMLNLFEGDIGVVHDSMSTHSVDIEHMMYYLRETFITMYNTEKPFLDVMRDMILTYQVGCDVEAPRTGSLNLEEIRQSDFFFS